RRARLDLGRLGKFGDLALLVVDQQEEVEIADGRRSAGALDHGLAPRLVVGALRRFDRRPDVDAGAGLTVELEQEMLALKLLVGAPFRDNVTRLLGDLLPAPAFW